MRSDDKPAPSITANARGTQRGAPPIDPALFLSDLYGDAYSPAKARRPNFWSGLAMVALALLASEFMADHYGMPATLAGLLIGLSVSFLSTDRRLEPGLQLCSTTLLRIGIVLAGARVTLGQVVDLGPMALLVLIGIMGLTIASGIALARLAGQASAFGVLAGGAVAICGASAALAISAVLGERRGNKSELAIVLVGISVMSAIAMLAYPAIAHLLGFSDRQASFFLGASIHDVAQTIGAGFAFSEPAGEGATIVKLARVAMLGPILILISLIAKPSTERRSGFVGLPWFVIGFALLMAINSTGIIPSGVSDALGKSATLLVTASVIAAAIRSPLAQIVNQGARPIAVIAGTTLVSALLSLLFAGLLL